jgi:hypothetical protein
VNELPTTACPHTRCAAPVIEVRIGPKLERKLVDAEPVSWEDGGRVRISTHQPDAPNGLVGRRLATAHRAFGLTAIYRPHDDTCKVARRRAPERAKSS